MEVKHTVRKIAVKKKGDEICIGVLNDDWKYTLSEWVSKNNPEKAFAQLWDILKEDKTWTKIYKDETASSN